MTKTAGQLQEQSQLGTPNRLLHHLLSNSMIAPPVFSWRDTQEQQSEAGNKNPQASEQAREQNTRTEPRSLATVPSKRSEPEDQADGQSQRTKPGNQARGPSHRANPSHPTTPSQQGERLKHRSMLAQSRPHMWPTLSSKMRQLLGPKSGPQKLPVFQRHRAGPPQLLLERLKEEGETRLTLTMVWLA